MRKFIRFVLAAFLLSSAAVEATAADLPPVPATPAPTLPDAFQPWQIRLRAVGLITSSGGGNTVRAQANGAYVSDGIKASNAVIPEIDISYYLTKNFALELVCCVSYHKLFLKGGPLANTQVGDTWVFPPTVMLQYHWTDFGKFQPYIGVGVNYTHYFNQQAAYGVLSHLSVNDSWGIAGQVGFDYMINDHWGVNVDVKKIMMEPSVTANLGNGTLLRGGARIDPWLIGAGITYRFGGPDAAPAPVLAKY
ncbi:OmpW/AlkL family protein [Beijerinckia indica]|uniref:OmpW/AlkL family protein n=1 Tax=Beijerinckia indica TaxID=533 RepID=UPI0005A23D06|nr:OmpW family outer membrane protein [Beijerinckia indica]